MNGPTQLASGTAGRRTDVSPRSPLSDVLAAYPQPLPISLSSENFDLAIGERAFLGKVAVLGSGEPFLAKASTQLGFELPQVPNTTASKGNVTAMWLSPSEWMLVTPPGHENALVRSPQQAVADDHALVVDVSDRWTVISVSGLRAVSVLSKGTSIDLKPTVFGISRCCQTHFFATPVIIRQTDETPAFDIFVSRSAVDCGRETAILGMGCCRGWRNHGGADG